MLDYGIQKLINNLVEESRKNGVELDEIYREIEARFKANTEDKKSFRDKAENFVKCEMYFRPKKTVGQECKRVERMIELLCIYHDLRETTPVDKHVEIERVRELLVERCNIKESTAKGELSLNRGRFVDYINEHSNNFNCFVAYNAKLIEILDVLVLYISQS